MHERIAELVTILRLASDEYYNNGESSITDEEYDVYERELRQLDPTNQFLLGVGSEVRGNKVKLPFVMPSLDQAHDGDIESWVSDHDLQNEKFVVADKLDGSSIMLVYGFDGKLQIAYTRGNGTEGQDVTRHVKRMKKVPLQTNGKMTVRAEVVMEEEIFQTNKTAIETEGGREFKNSRNFAAGQINATTALDLFYEHVDVVAYEIIWPEDDKSDQYDILNSLGFKTAEVAVVTGDALTTNFLREWLLKRLGDSVYTLDGVVIDVNDVVVRQWLNTNKKSSKLNPAYAKKFKVVTADNIAVTEVLGIEWKVSAAGYVKPTVLLTPTELVGVTIKRATGFNAKFIRDHQIGPGAKVEICRSGDVIPFIRKVIKHAPAGAALPNDTDFGTYHWSGNDVDIILDNEHSDAKFQRLVIGMKTLGAEHLAEKNLKKLFDAGYNTLADVIKLANVDDITLVGYIIGSEKMAEKGLASLRSKLNGVSLEVLGDASGAYGRGIGTRKLRKVANVYGRITGLTLEEILAVEGYSEITAQQVLDGEAEFLTFLDTIKDCYTLAEKNEKIKVEGGSLAGKVFVFTGFRDANAEKTISEKGGEVGSSVNSKTTHLVAKDTSKQSGKMKKAAAKGIAVISRDEMLEMING